MNGANASAVVYTMVEMAHSLNVYGYLRLLLKHRPSKEMTDEYLAELAPWNRDVKKACSGAME